jgi:hypothetical protein
MSSLGISLLLLVALAVAVAVLYNLRQSRPRLRWPSSLRLPRGLRRPADAGVPDAAPRRVAQGAAGTGAGAAQAGSPRGEPRLAKDVRDDGAFGAADDAPSVRPDVRPDEARDRELQGFAATRPLASLPAADEPAAQAIPGVAGLPGVAGAAGAGRGDEPAEHRPSDAGEARQPAPGGAAPLLLSDACDCIVEMALPASCPGERLIALAQRFRRAGSKPVAVEGLPAQARDDAWGALAPTRQYAALRIGILMANRHGPLNAMEYSEFVAGVQAIAESLSTLADTPDMAGVLARARDLDATCAQLDAQIGINVETPETLGPAQLASLAGTLAVVERGSNRYARLGAQGEVVFSVALADVPNRLTFLLDVPRSSPASDAWNRMREAANACAQRVGGRLVDDGGRTLAEASLAQIGRQLAQRYESLEAIGLPAGSPLALRVFN